MSGLGPFSISFPFSRVLCRAGFPFCKWPLRSQYQPLFNRFKGCYRAVREYCLVFRNGSGSRPSVFPITLPTVLGDALGLSIPESCWLSRLVSGMAPKQGPLSGPEKGVITKGVFSLKESLESLESLISLESLDNGRTFLCFPQSGGSLKSLESLDSLESLENGLF